MSDDLKEKVARAICQEQCAFYGEPSCWDVADGPSPRCDEPGCQAFADAAIALIWNEAMEEAAEICEAKGEEWRADGNISAGVGCNTCTDAIRARKKP